MYYVNLNDSTELDVLQVVKSDDVFLMNIPQKKIEHKQMIQVNHSLCVHKNKKNRCAFEESKHYMKRCKESGCVYFSKG